MRLEVGGAQITEAVVDVIDTLQNEPEVLKAYVEAIDRVTGETILSISGIDEDDSVVLGRLRVLQKLRRDLITLGNPPDVDLPENDIPTVTL